MTPSPSAPRVPERDRRFSVALSDAIARQGLTLGQVQGRLAEADAAVSRATLSYWQRGHSLPTRESSLRTIRELEVILRLPVGHLTATLPGDTFSRWETTASMPLIDAARAVFTAMGIDPLDHWVPSWIHDDVTVGPDATRRTETLGELFTSTRDGLERTALIFGLEPGALDTPGISDLVGCRLGRVVELASPALLVVELLLPRVLARGDRHLRSARLHWERRVPPAVDDTTRILPTTVPHLVMEASFAGPAPSRAQYRTSPREFDHDQRGAELVQEMPVSNHLQVCLADAAAGWHSLQWQRGDEGELGDGDD